MAIFHSTTKIIARSDGHNAVQAAAYRAGTRLQCRRTGQVFNFTRKTEVTHRAILAPPGSPSWATDRSVLWNQIESSETRNNSQLAREVEVALPVELTHQQHIDLITEYVSQQFVAMGMVADIAIHSKVGKNGKPDNPHCHIMLTLRELTPDSVGAKRRDWNQKSLVTKWRAAWADACNSALQTVGTSQRIDHRSNRVRGIERSATVHVGRQTPWNAEALQERIEHNRTVDAWTQANTELRRVLVEVKHVQSQLLDLTSSISQALAMRDAPTPTTSIPPAAIWTPHSGILTAPITGAELRQRPGALRHPTQRKKSTHATTSRIFILPRGGHGPSNGTGGAPC